MTQRHRSPDGALVADTVIGDYVIVREIGRGGFGITYEARNRLHQPRALKEFALTGLGGSSPTGGTSAEELAKIRDWALQRFRDTTFQLARLEHPNIVRVDDYIAGENTGFMVMELLKGSDLAKFIRARAPMGLKEVRTAIEPIMDALEYMHERGIIHRDIKPENIMFRGDGTPVLIDFGTVRAISTEAASQAERLGLTRFSPRERSQTYAVLSPRYAAPEQDDPDHALKPAVDVFAIGAVMYEMLTGKPPMESSRRMGRFASGGDDPVVKLETTMTGNAADLPVMRVIDAALELPVSKRPASIIAFRQALGWAPQVAPAAARAPKTAALPPPSAGRGKKLAALALGLVLIAGSGAAFYEWRSREAAALLASEQAAREQAATATAAREAEQRRLAAEEAARTSAEAAEKARQITLQRQQQETAERARAREAELALERERQRVAEQQAAALRTQQERSQQERALQEQRRLEDQRRLDEQRRAEELRRLAEEKAEAERLQRQQQLAAEQALLRQRELEVERERQRLEASQRALEQQQPVPAPTAPGLGQGLALAFPPEPERPRLSDEAITGDRSAASPILEEELLAALTAKGCHLGSKASASTLQQTEEAMTRFLAKTRVPRPAQPFTQGFLDQVRQAPDNICAPGARPLAPVVARPPVTRPKAARTAPAPKAAPKAARTAPAANPRCFIANGQQFCG